MRVRTTNNRLIGFAYKPGSGEEAELIVAGQSTEKAAEHQHFNVTPEGVDLPERVGAYALNLYGAQMEAVGNEAREAGVAELEELLGVEGQVAETTTSASTNVEISGEDEPPLPAPTAPFALCPSCDETFTAKTLAAAKGKLTRHTKKEHV